MCVCVSACILKYIFNEKQNSTKIRKTCNKAAYGISTEDILGKVEVLLQHQYTMT